MDISARAISLADRPQGAIWVTGVRMRRQDRSSISFSSSRRPRQVRCFDASLITRPESCSPRMLGHEPGRSKQCERACWRARWRGRCDATASWPPKLEPVPVPVLRLDQYNPGGLNEQNAQVAIAAFRYLAEDGAVAGRDLLGDEPQPGGEVAAFRERIAGADRSYHRAGDDWSNPRDAHQPLTTRVSARKGLDLAR